MKHIFSALALSIFSSFSAPAQDTVYLRDGSVEYARIAEVNSRQIIYTRTTDPGGREERLGLNNIERIHFAGGTVQHFGDAPSRNTSFRARSSKDDDARGTSRRQQPEVVYGKNIVSFAPIQITDEGARGLGVHFERIIDQRSIISVYLPVSITFPDRRSNIPVDPWGGATTARNATPFIYLYPGVRIYPGGANGKVRYSVGPSLVLGFGSIDYTQTIFNPATGQRQFNTVRENVFRSGIIINNGLNIHATPKLVLGMEGGLGYSYVNNVSAEAPTIFLGQLNFKIGYRF